MSIVTSQNIVPLIGAAGVVIVNIITALWQKGRTDAVAAKADANHASNAVAIDRIAATQNATIPAMGAVIATQSDALKQSVLVSDIATIQAASPTAPVAAALAANTRATAENTAAVEGTQ